MNHIDWALPLAITEETINVVCLFQALLVFFLAQHYSRYNVFLWKDHLNTSEGVEPLQRVCDGCLGVDGWGELVVWMWSYLLLNLSQPPRSCQMHIDVMRIQPLQLRVIRLKSRRLRTQSWVEADCVVWWRTYKCNVTVNITFLQTIIETFEANNLSSTHNGQNLFKFMIFFHLSETFLTYIFLESTKNKNWKLS